MADYFGHNLTGEALKVANLGNGIWNQWIEPVSVALPNGILLTGCITDEGVPTLVAYNPSTDTLQRVTLGTAISVDDHNCPAILLGDDPLVDPIQVYWTGHGENGSNPMRAVSGSNHNGDIRATTWGAEDQVHAANFCTYTQIFRNSDGRIVFFNRGTQNAASGDRGFNCFYSDDDGDTFTKVEVFFSDHDPGPEFHYIKFVQTDDPDILYGAVHYHPTRGDNDGDQDVHVFKVDLDTGNVTNIGSATVLHNVYTSTTGTRWNPFLSQRIYTADTTKFNKERTRLWGINKHGEVYWTRWWYSSAGSNNNLESHEAEVMYAKVDTDGTLHGPYKCATMYRGTGDFYFHGQPIETPAGQNFYFHAVEPDEVRGVAYIGRKLGDLSFVEKIKTTDDGATWESEGITDVKTDRKTFRPSVPRGRNAVTVNCLYIEGDPSFPEGGYICFSPTVYSLSNHPDYYTRDTSYKSAIKLWRV